VSAGRTASVLAVASGKGGAGKTSVAVDGYVVRESTGRIEGEVPQCV
jgi:hypothetical protein